MNDLLKAYLDNALPEADRARVEAELAANPALQQELEEIRATGQYIEASAKTVTVTGLEATLSALSPKPRRAWFRSPYAVLAASTLVLAFGLSFYKPGTMAHLESSKATMAASTADSAPANTGSATAESASPVESEAYAEKAKGADTAGGGAFFNPPTKEPARGRYQAPDQTNFGSNQTNPQSNVPGDNRLIIRNANIGVRVKQLQPAIDRTEAIAKQYGGFVESSNRSDARQAKYAYFSIRVDSKKFDQAMNDLRELGDVTSESIYGEDVTAQVADAEARLKQKRLEEAQYQEVLKSARKVSEILEVKDYINNVREEIEATEATLKSLKNLASLSTISVNLEQREEVKSAPRTDWLSNAWIRAMNRFSGIGRYLVGTLINILVLAPFWLPFALGIWWWNRKRKRG